MVIGEPSVNITGTTLSETRALTAEEAGEEVGAEVAVHGGSPNPTASRIIVVAFTQTISVPLEVQVGTENGVQIKGDVSFHPTGLPLIPRQVQVPTLSILTSRSSLRDYPTRCVNSSPWIVTCLHVTHQVSPTAVWRSRADRRAGDSFGAR